MFSYIYSRKCHPPGMSITADKQLIDQLLKERDTLYQELSQLREIDNGALERARRKNDQYQAIITQQDE